jgi:hypothetical protein
MVQDIIFPLQNWIPTRFSQQAPGQLLEWFDVGDKHFTEPFFEDTLSAIKRMGANKRNQYRSTSLPAMLPLWSAEMQPVKTAAVIFHVSRCGSTLLSQMLSLDPENIVLSEPPFLDEILRMPYKEQDWSIEKSESYLRTALQFYGQIRFPGQRRMILKTDSWHLHFYKTLRAVFPGNPFILLFRDAAGVLRSQQKKRGMHAVPGMIEQEIFGFQGNPVASLDQHFANVLGSYYRQMIEIINQDPLAFSFNYNNGISKLVAWLYTRNGFKTSNELKEKFDKRSLYNANDARQLFLKDEDPGMPVILNKAYGLYKQLDSLSTKIMEA